MLRMPEYFSMYTLLSVFSFPPLFVLHSHSLSLALSPSPPSPSLVPFAAGLPGVPRGVLVVPQELPKPCQREPRRHGRRRPGKGRGDGQKRLLERRQTTDDDGLE